LGKRTGANKMKIKSFSVIVTVLMLVVIIPTSIIAQGQDETAIYLEYNFMKPIVTSKGGYDGISDSITIEGLEKLQDTGIPMLPVKPIRVLLPQDKTIKKISVKTNDEKEIPGTHFIERGAQLVPLISSVDVKYTGIHSYSQQSLKIEKMENNDGGLYSITGSYNWRGFKILYLTLHPVIYDETTGKISYHTSMELRIDLYESEPSGGYRNLRSDDMLISSLVENPEEISSYTKQYQSLSTIDTAQYLIITNEQLKQANGEKTFQDLAESKINQGISAKIITVEEILADPDFSVNGIWGDNNPDNPFYQEDVSDVLTLFDDRQARIRNYIRYAYTELGTEYVLLAGDSDEIVLKDNTVPCRKLFADEEGLPLNGILEYEADDIPSDVYYACLDGNFNDDHDDHFGESSEFNNENDVDEADLLAEVYVGRACVDSSEEVSNFVSKTLWYEQTNDDYLKNIAFIGEYLGFPGVSAYGGNYKDYIEAQVNIPDRYLITKIYDREERWDFMWLHGHLCSNSYHLINHDGHGNEYYIMKSGGDGIRCLTNEKPFFIYSHSCLTGSFDNWDCYQGFQEHDCIAEILTCEIPYGAFACILNARYGLGSDGTLESPSGAYDESFYRAIFEENIAELGHASHYSKEDHIWQIDENGMRWCYYQTNLFGDPSLRVKTPNTAPSTPSLNGNDQGKIGEEQQYFLSSQDPESDNIFYLVDWGDGTNTDWIGPYQPGAEVMVYHTYTEKNTYLIQVKAKDVYDAESQWATLDVTMPKARDIHRFGFAFLPNLFHFPFIDLY